MIHHPSRRDIVKTTAKLAAVSSLGVGCTAMARAREPTGPGAGTFSHVDTMLRSATSAGELPGVAALAATDNDIVYEGIFGSRRLQAGPSNDARYGFSYRLDGQADYFGGRAAARRAGQAFAGRSGA